MKTIYRVNINKYPRDTLFDFDTAVDAVRFLETAASHICDEHKSTTKLALYVEDIEENKDDEESDI